MKLKGLYLDSAEIDTPPGMYRFAKNIVATNTLQAIENEDGFKELDEYAPYTTIGFIPMVRSIAVFSTDNTDSEVGVIEISADYSTYTYTTIYNDPELNFSTSSPIKGRYKTNLNNDRIITWIDADNIPRILNLDDTTNINDVNDLALFQDIVNPQIETGTISDSGGALKTGAIIPITKYRNEDGSETNWFVHDKVFYIADEPSTVAFNEMDGAEGGSASNKSINITLSDCDTRFTQLVIGYIQSINNIVTAKEIRVLDNSSTLTYAITGTETTTDLSLDEVLTAATNYNNALAISDLNGRLFLGNLTAEELPELQEAALSISINYTTELINVVSNTEGHKTQPPTLIPGEVYAFYLGVELLRGGWACYHIPGRASITGDTTEITNEGMTYKTFQVGDTVDGVGAATNMGYWENSSEVYPEDEPYIGAGLNGQPVRHHRMPTLDYLVENVYSADATVGISFMPTLAITASDVNIPAELQAKIKRWKIFYAKKDIGNSLFLGSDLLQFGVGPSSDNTQRWSSGGNWFTSITQSGWQEFNFAPRDTIRGHSHDMLIRGDSGLPTYARFNYQLERENLNATYTGFRSDGALLSVTGGNNGNHAAVIDYTNTSYTTRTQSGFIKSLSNFSYLAANGLFGKFNTSYTEGVFIADINTPSTDFGSVDFDTVRIRSGGESQFPSNWFLVGYEHTMSMQYFKLLAEVHSSVFTQDLIPLLGYAAPDETTLDCTGGDGFACYLSFLTASPRTCNAAIEDQAPFLNGVRIWRGYLGYSRYNLNFRHQTTGDPSTYYHGKIDVRDLFSPSLKATFPTTEKDILFDLTSSVNIIDYNQDYNLLNQYLVNTIWSPSLVQETEFPNTIIYSPVQGEENKEFAWRLFPAGNRYVMPKNKGVIKNLQNFNNNELLIHHEFSIYRTRTDAKHQVEGENIFLKSANIFDLPPEELIPNASGYAGLSNRFGPVLTKAGYAWIDDLQGKVFLYTGQALDEISNFGLRTFFRDFMQLQRSEAIFDNPFISYGYTIGYDERFNRLLISKKHGDESWTISYNPGMKSWTSFHDYTPDYLFQGTDSYLYALKDNVLYLTNYKPTDTEKGVYFGNAEPYSSYIDVVHNEEAYRDKEFVGAQWVTEVYPNGETNGQLDTTLDYTTTCTHLTLRTPQHCTGRVDLILFEDLDSLYEQNIRNLNRTWYFDDVRDIVVDPGFVLGFYENFEIEDTKLNINLPWYDQRKFIDKYVICRYEFDNQENKRFILLGDKITFKYAVR